MDAIAKLNNCPTSPRKMRLVVDNIRGRNVNDALNILEFSPQHAALKVEKLLRSAIANWEQKNETNAGDKEFVKEAFVDSARVLKRFRPAPMGRATKIRKRSNHVTIVIGSRQTEKTETTEE